MTSFRIKPFAFLFAALISLISAGAQPAFLQKATFQVIPEQTSVAPGSTFTVAVEAKMSPGWHSYWEYPNLEIAILPAITLKLPEGWKPGPLQYPHPVLYSTGAERIFVNEGAARFLMDVSVPADAKPGPVEIETGIDMIVCNEQNCVPASDNVKFTVTVADAAVPNADAAALFAEARAELPKTIAGTSAAVKTSDSGLRIEFKGLPETVKAEGLTFFPLNAESAKPAAKQTFTLEGGTLILETEGSEKPVEGVLVSAEPVFDGSKALRITAGSPTAPAEPAAAATPPAATGKGSLTQGFSWALLIQAFFGGMLLNIMPCVFPVIGLKIMGFVSQSGHDSKKVILHGLAYTAGVVIFFLILGAVILSIRKGGEMTSFGEFFMNPRFNFIMASVLIALGLSFLGVFEFGAGMTSAGGKLQYISGYAGSFFSGFLTVVLATPCAGFLLGYVLAVAFAVSYGQAMAIFLFIALGIAAPYMILSIFPKLVRFLPKPGRWMEIAKQFFGILMLGAALWLGWIISTQIDTGDMLVVWLCLMVVAIAVWVYGIAVEPGRKAKGKVIGLSLAALILLAGFRYGYPVDKPQLTWEPWTPEVEQQLIQEKKPVYVDFTASWCLQCQTNKHVYKSDEMQALFRKKGVTTLRADWSKPNPAIGKALEKLERGAIPVNVVYYPGEETPLILSPLLTESEIRAALEKLPDV